MPTPFLLFVKNVGKPFSLFSLFKVLYNDELTSLTDIMRKIKGYSNIAEPSYFTYKGEALTEIAERTQWKQ